MLVGQPELRNKLLSPTLQQLHQRIVTSSELQRLNANQSRDYFLHCLRTAGWVGLPSIEDGTFEPLHRASNGVPRWINQIGSRLLLSGMLEDKSELGALDVKQVIDDLIGESLLPQSVRSAQLHSIASDVAQQSDVDY